MFKIKKKYVFIWQQLKFPFCNENCDDEMKSNYLTPQKNFLFLLNFYINLITCILFKNVCFRRPLYRNDIFQKVK